MTASRLFFALAIAFCLAAPAAAQTRAAKPARPNASLAARITALEKDNAALRQDVDRLQALVTQTRRDMIVTEGAAVSGYAPGVVSAPVIQPMSLPAQQAGANAAIQQQNVNQQLNTLQLQQSMTQDRLREQQLLQPAAPFGGAP